MESQIKVHVMHTGRVKVDRALPYKELDVVPPVHAREESYRMWLPISSYLIEHPDGNIVVDAGWHEDVRANAQAHLGAAASFVEYELPAGWSIREQLAARRLSPSDIDIVVISHLDVDHISGLSLLRGARSFWVSEPELANAKPHKLAWYGGLPVRTFAYESIPYGPNKRGRDLFGDGRIYLVDTPGHTPGQLSVLVRLRAGWLLLASDTGYTGRSLEESILPGITTDERQAAQSLQWTKAFSERSDCIGVLLNHDPAIVPATYR